MVQKGKDLCEDLVDNVRQQYEDFRSRPPRGDRGGYGDHYRGGRSQEQGSYPSYGRSGSDTGANPGSSGGGADGAANASDWTQYAAQYYGNGQDPYAAYGGYQK